MAHDRQPSSDPARQEQVVERSPRAADPTQVEAERTSVTSTQTAGGLAGGSPLGGPAETPERENVERQRAIEPRVRGGRNTPKSEPEDEKRRSPDTQIRRPTEPQIRPRPEPRDPRQDENPVMPDDDQTLRTEI